MTTPTFADLCEAVRAARREHIRAIEATDAASEALKAAKEAQKIACDAEDDARDALESFIDAETKVAS